MPVTPLVIFLSAAVGLFSIWQVYFAFRRGETRWRGNGCTLANQPLGFSVHIVLMACVGFIAFAMLLHWVGLAPDPIAGIGDALDRPLHGVAPSLGHPRR